MGLYGAHDRLVLTTATSTDPTLAADQQAVLGAQQQVDAAINSADAAIAIALETTACSSFPGLVRLVRPRPSSLVGGHTPRCHRVPPGDHGGQQTAQQKAIADAQHTLATASSALDTYLGQLAA